MTTKEFIDSKIEMYSKKTPSDFVNGELSIYGLFSQLVGDSNLVSYELGQLDAINDMLQFLEILPKDKTITKVLNKE